MRKILIVAMLLLSACGGQIKEGCLHTEPMRLNSLPWSGVFYLVTFYTDSGEYPFCGPTQIDFQGETIEAEKFFDCADLQSIQNPQYLAGRSCVFTK